MNTEYNPEIIETEAQEEWERRQCFAAHENLTTEKFYCLSMFPYPSGTAHMGHVRNYTIGDVISRYQRARGKNVLQPFGWDAFGLPAENAAIKNGIHPLHWTKTNIASMKKQFKRLGFAFDWHREFATCDPSYYRWEQWFFIQLFNKGLVYKKNSVVNWDPVDKTVLANEQVIDGKGWRSGAPIERREISQWFIKITAYAEELLNDLDVLPNWPEQVKQMQRNWIGRSVGCEVEFEMLNQKLTVFTTRPDTLMGVTYLAIAAEHPLSKQLIKNNPKIASFVKSCQGTKVAEAELMTKEKSGIDTGLTAKHPITQQELPIWIANFVLMDYGSGAIMAVPGHDKRDAEFAAKYKLPILTVIDSNNKLINSGKFNGIDADIAKHKITEFLLAKNLGKTKINYRLRDWGVSRQRYWGTPIPMIHCETCGIVPVAEQDLPVTLPEDVTFTGQGSPLEHHPSFKFTSCPKCHKDALRELDTFDTFLESSWYYARFACPDQNASMLDDRANYWTPVDQYIGGIEHAVMHLLYARLFHKMLRDFGLVNSQEPFNALLTQGMVLKDGHKMSKSLGNIVDPNELIARYGADTARLFVMFAAPPEQSLEYSDSGVEGSFRFLKRIWNYCLTHAAIIKDINNKILENNGVLSEIKNNNSRRNIHNILQQANNDYERKQFNTVVSACMKLFNEISNLNDKNSAEQYLIYEGLSILLRLLAPITPHICHKLWLELNFSDLIINAPWPKVDKDALVSLEKRFTVQVNGRLKGQLAASHDATEKELIELAKNFVGLESNQTITKAIIVMHRQLINLVIT